MTTKKGRQKIEEQIPLVSASFGLVPALDRWLGKASFVQMCKTWKQLSRDHVLCS